MQAAELSHRRRKMPTHRISAANEIRLGDRRRQKILRRLAEIVELLETCNWIWG